MIEKLRRMGLTSRGPGFSVLLALLFAFGTVYFFTAEQGTVWFAAHVVGAALAALYVLFALDAAHPVLAGLVLGFAFMTRPPILYAAPLFALEALRVSTGTAPLADRVGFFELLSRIDKKKLTRALVFFAIPVGVVLLLAAWYNQKRFDSPLEFGYRYLTVLWRPRMEKWGLFNYHYLGKNLGVALTGLPWIPKPYAGTPFLINAHGLAFWFTTPLYVWLLWPRRRTRLHFALVVTVLVVAVPTLFYQNTGWVQFGYRFSNDYAVFLFCLLAIGGFRFGPLFFVASLWSVAVNSFGAATFQKPGYARFYYQEGTQTVMHQPD